MTEERIPRDRIDAALDRIENWFEDSHAPGASVAVTDGDELVVERGFGRRRLDPDAPATGATRYAVGSVAKPVTALAVLLLDERGQIDVGAPVSEYVPYFGDAPGDPITVRQLLSHTSGMPSDDVAFHAGELDGWDAFRAFLDGTVDRRRVDGQHFLYYNSGYAVLARLVAVVSGTAFPAFVEREVFDPLDTSRSTFDGSVIGAKSEDVMAPYVPEDGGRREAPVSDNPVLDSPILNGPGGLVTSATDLATFVGAHVGAAPRVNGVPVERTRTPVATRKRFVDGTEHAYGYGWELEPFGSDTLVGHGGNTGASGGFAGFLEERGIGVAIGCNANVDAASIAREALAVLTDRDPHPSIPSDRSNGTSGNSPGATSLTPARTTRP